MSQEKLYLKYVSDLAFQLAQEYSVQYQNMEWFARWNLPEEIGLEWIDAEEIIKSDVLSESIPSSAYGLLLIILEQFDCAFDDMDSDIWTHEGMRENPFWKNQRSLAKEFLEIIASDE